MKKITLLLVLVLVCAFTLTACEDQDAYELYTNMSTAMEEITSSQAKVDMKMSVEAGGENVDMNINMDMKQITHSETDIEMEMLMNIDMGELGVMDGTMYFKDGSMYLDMMGMKMKMEVPLEQAMEIAGSANFDTGSIVSEEAITQSAVKNVGSDKELSFTLNGELLNDVLNEMMGQMMQQMGGTGADLAFGDVSYTVLVGADNLPKEEHIVFSMDMDIQGETAKATYDMTMTTTDYNNVTSIDYPADLDAYSEMPASAIPAA